MPVTRVCDLLGLRSYFMSQLGPHYLWILNLSMIEWPTLSTQEKQLHTVVRKSFVTSYAFGAEAILQHLLWKTLKNTTKSFGPLLKVFATDYDATSSCCTNDWESIFTLFPCTGTAITHQLIVSGFEQCMSLQDDSKHVCHPLVQALPTTCILVQRPTQGVPIISVANQRARDPPSKT